VYDMHSLSAAHPTLPMPSYVRVTNLNNRRSVIVRINDRGPYHRNREIDLSGRAAELLGFRGDGIARVRVEYVGQAPMEGSADRRLEATLREGAPAPAPSNVMLASAKPFVPAVASRSPIMSSGAPEPPDRPFDLGGTADREAALGPVRTMARVPAPQERTLAAASAGPRLQWTTGPQPAVSAYAPAAYDGSTSVATGRGLY